MKLKFYPAIGTRVADRNMPAATGQPRHYVGRKFTGKPGEEPATGEAYEADANSTFGRDLVSMARKDYRAGCPCLWPADEATAALCDVPLVKLELVDGEMVPATAAPKKLKEPK
jgi:hypothetical protein